MSNAEIGMLNADVRMLNADVRMLGAESSSGKRRKAVWGSGVKVRVKVTMAVALSIAMLLALTSCSDAMRTGQSPSYLIIQGLTGGSQNSAVVQSDVLLDNGTILQDNGAAVLEVALKDPLGSTPTTVNAITITQYHVEYVRSDGHNVQGVDVPYAFDGGVTTTIPAGNTGAVNFTLVRVEAKLEAPLKALAHEGGQIVISTIAHVTFYGHDQNGRQISVEGTIEVDFADWAG